MGLGTYHTDTSGMAKAHGHVEAALLAAPDFVMGASAPERVEAVTSFYGNLLEYVHVHHGSEDEVLYPRLHDRCVEGRETIERIGGQHRLLDEPMAAAYEAMSDWRRNPSDANAVVLLEALTRMHDVFSSHCRDEEEMVMPLASRYLSPQEWHEMLAYESEHFELDKPWVFLGWALDRADDAHRAAILAMLPDPLRVQWDSEWSSSYEALMANVRP